jgi:hypothetical protein
VGVAFVAWLAFAGGGCTGQGKQAATLDAGVAPAAPLAPDAAASPPPDAAPVRDAAPEAEKPIAPEVPTVVLPGPGDPAEPEDTPGAGDPPAAADDARTLTRAVQAARGRIERCAQEDDGGTVTVHVTVSAAGQLVRVTTDGDARDHLVKCTTQALHAAHFPRLGHETTVSVKFDFPVFLR